jgi:AcrR family transcriptional regulator
MISPSPVKVGAVKPRQKRGELTRLKIKAALTQLLDGQDYFDLTITDICREAGVATGGFYFHYAKKADLLGEVISEHNATFWARLTGALHYRDPYSAIFYAATALVGAYLDAPGVVRCFNQLAMTDRVFVEMWDDAARDWVAGLVETLNLGVGGGSPISPEEGYSLLGFIDLLLFKTYIERDPLLVESAGDVEEVIENIAVLWYRGLVGASPPSARLAYPGRGLGV